MINQLHPSFFLPLLIKLNFYSFYLIAIIPLIFRKIMQLLLNPNSDEIEKRSVRPTASQSKQSSRLLLDLSKGMISRHADRKIYRSTVASAEQTLVRLSSVQRTFQQPLLSSQRKHRIGDAATLYPRCSHLGHDVAQPARVNSTAWPEKKSSFPGCYLFVVVYIVLFTHLIYFICFIPVGRLEYSEILHSALYQTMGRRETGHTCSDDNDRRLDLARIEHARVQLARIQPRHPRRA